MAAKMTDPRAQELFIDDLTGADYAYGIAVRAPVARGSIQKIELPELPPGFWAVRAEDIPGDPLLRSSGSDMPFLTGSQVCYRGEPVLLLAGPDRETLISLAEAVQIRCRESEAVTRLEEVNAGGLKAELHLHEGDPEKAFQDSYQIVEGSYTLGPQNPLGRAPQGAVAVPENRTLTVWAAVLDPFFMRDQIASLLALSQRRVRVRVPRVRQSREEQALTAVLAAGHAALLANAGGRPVKLFYEPRGEACWYPEGSRCRIRQSTALDREGKILGVRMEIVLDIGAYRTCTRGLLRDALSAVCGIYRCANIEVVGKLAQTSTHPAGLSGSTTRAAVAFATELQQARLAEISQLDPYVWKQEQLQPRAAALPGRRGGPAAAALERAVTASDFCRKYAAYAAMNTRRRTYLAPPHPLRGVGLSLCVQNEAGEQSFSLPASPRTCSVKVCLEADKRLHIYSSIVETGQRRDTLFTAAAAGFSEERNPVLEPVDTLTVPDSGYSSLEATLEISRLIGKCCQTLEKRRSGAALPLETRRSLRFAPEKVPRRQRDTRMPRTAGAWAATVVEVEVDAETLHPSCRRIVMAVEAGAAGYARAQLKAGILRALGRATWEGRKEPCPFTDSELAPEVSVEFVQMPGREQHCRAFDALPDLGVAAAFVSAVSQATGLYIDQIPLTAEVIQRCLLAAEK